MTSGQSSHTARRRNRSKAATGATSRETEARLTTLQHEKRLQEYQFRLFVNGMTWASARAIECVRAICDKHLGNHYRLEVVDIFQLPALARNEQIVATPTLVKAYPLPVRRYIGDLSNVEKLLFDLDLCGSSDDSTQY